MRLSEATGEGVTVVRDGDFSSIGTVTDRKARALVHLSRERDIPAMGGNEGISCVITTEALAGRVPERLGLAVSAAPLQDLLRTHDSLARSGSFYPAPGENRISPEARIDPAAAVGPMGVVVGPRCVVGPRAVLLEGTTLEEGVVVGPGTVLGADPGTAYRGGDGPVRVRPTGGVHVSRNVEMHANCTVSRAVLGGATEIGEYTAFDNLVSIGPNARVGRRCFLPACAAVGGDAVIGDDVWVGPNAVVSEGVVVGDGAHVTIGAVVTEDVPAGRKVSGNFAVDHDRFIEFIKRVR